MQTLQKGEEMDNEKDIQLYEYTIYDSQTGDVLDTIIVDEYLGEEPKVEMNLTGVRRQNDKTN